MVTSVDAGKGLEAREFSTFTFSHWANKLRFLMERSKLKREIKNDLNCTCGWVLINDVLNAYENEIFKLNVRQ